MSAFWRPQQQVLERESAKDGNLITVNRYRHLSIAQQRINLPIHRYRENILYLLEKFSTLVLVGETGCGKSTQIPQYLVEAGWAAAGHSIVCTQPRRVAVLTVAARVAEEYGCTLGSDVGYGMRFEFLCQENTKIRYYTDGVLLRETMTDPLLSKYSVVIVDEAHQRSIHSDILLGLLKKIRRRRKDLRIVVTSATLDAVSMKNFFESNNSSDTSLDDTCILSIQGRMHPVDILYLEVPCRDFISETVSTVQKIHKLEDVGDILVFLPGAEEIETAIRLLNLFIDEETSKEYSQGKPKVLDGTRLASSLYALPLYSGLAQNQQMRVFEPTPPLKRKVIMATNIAEASVTIEGVRFVIDCGFVKLPYLDVKSGITSLRTVVVSSAMAQQRAGRAGRTQPGKCFRLAPEAVFTSNVVTSHFQSCHVGSNLSLLQDSEMGRCDITGAVLQLKALGVHDVLHFDFITPPTPQQMIFALEVLFSLGALDGVGRITAVGLQMAEMPLEPRLARCLLHSCTEGSEVQQSMLSIAAMSAVEYPFVPLSSAVRKDSESAAESRLRRMRDIESFVVVGSDHLTLLNIFNQFSEISSNATSRNLASIEGSWCEAHSLQLKILHRAKEIRKNLAASLTRISSSSFASSPSIEQKGKMGSLDKRIRRCLVSGYFSQCAKLANDGRYRSLRGGVPLIAHPSTSVVASFGVPPEWIVFHEAVSHERSKSQEEDIIYMREVTQIDPLWLHEIAPHYFDLHL